MHDYSPGKHTAIMNNRVAAMLMLGGSDSVAGTPAGGWTIAPLHPKILYYFGMRFASGLVALASLEVPRESPAACSCLELHRGVFRLSSLDGYWSVGPNVTAFKMALT